MAVCRSLGRLARSFVGRGLHGLQKQTQNSVLKKPRGDGEQNGGHENELQHDGAAPPDLMFIDL